MDVYIFGLFLVIIYIIIKLAYNIFINRNKNIVIKNYLNDTIFIYISVLILDYIVKTYFDVKIVENREELPIVYTDEPTF